ncbi:MAG: UDP-3-O-(3-hydroxymyristoyl)glucosamine N-acyltransferase [Burkholderiales bacterium]|nr:UDP-3-O-(3-hydroxymyristoyl)glucosamine N-acyltransferase [Burkholderiales bacterium]
MTVGTRKPVTLGALVARFGGRVEGDARTRVDRVGTLEEAGPRAISFLANERYLAQLGSTRAAAVIVGEPASAATNLPRIVCDNPYAYFARVSALLNPPPRARAGIHRTAVVERGARLGRGVEIGAHAVIARGARIGAGSVIGAGCIVGECAAVGSAARLYPNVTVYRECVIGARAIVHSGAVIGADGFGIAMDDERWIKVPQIGRVVIGDDVEIGANTTIDRGAIGDTVIEEGVKLDNLIQIAHNVRVGAHTAIAACVGIAGSVRIGRNCRIGGMAGIVGHVSIADGVEISACTLVTRSIAHRGTYTGVYAFGPHDEWRRNAAQLRHLAALARRVRALERESAGTEGRRP